MKKTLFEDQPKEKRGTLLQDNCDSVEEKGYMKSLAPEEIQQSKEQLSETAIQINDIEVEKKDVVKSFRLQLGPLFTTRNVLLKNIKEKAVYKKETCFKFVEQEERMVGYYNSEGDLIESRPAMADELQGTIFQINRNTGTNN